MNEMIESGAIFMLSLHIVSVDGDFLEHRNIPMRFFVMEYANL